MWLDSKHLTPGYRWEACLYRERRWSVTARILFALNLLAIGYNPLKPQELAESVSQLSLEVPHATAVHAGVGQRSTHSIQLGAASEPGIPSVDA